MNRPLFDAYLHELKSRARSKTKLLKEREIMLSDEALALLENMNEDDACYLYRKLIRPRKKRESDRQVPASAQLR